jgi:peptidoglycan/LPS O-acetylase OafA/YrhL
MRYRAEIDGLRAVAVFPVILFHAGFEHFNGGFVGVDVFFVISGYLITTIILAEKEQGTFSLVNFYERRARRILPALFLVMFVSLPFAWLWLLPSDMKDFSQSLVAVSTFTSNILFWHETGYWGAANELKPLLHTWSLSVEEQYYILFPLFLILMWRFRRRWIFSSFVVIAAISLIVSQWGAYNNPSANFFLLPTRGWELAIGAGIAFYFLYRKQTIRTLLSHKFIGEVLGLVGLLMIGYAVFTFDQTVPFPSGYALIPTIGAALIILFSSPETLVGRLLGTKVLVGIGLIRSHFKTYLKQ